MTLETYPAHFPGPLDIVNMQPVDSIVRTPMEIGDKARRAYTEIRYLAEITTATLTGEKARYFMAWWKHKVAEGADWFEMDLRFGDVVSTEEVRPKGALNMEKLNNDQYRVKFTAEVRTDSAPTESAYDAWAALQ